MNRITIIYDTPQKTCDKLWVYNEIVKLFTETQAIYAKNTISVIHRKNKLKYVLLLFDIVWRGLKKASQTNIYVVWSPRIACLLNLLLPNKKIISFNWLTPSKYISTINFYLHKKALNNPNFLPIVNDKNNISLYTNKFSLPITRQFCYLPDIYDDRVAFQETSEQTLNSDYFFTGGMNNRDFGLILKIAKQLPNYNFVIVSLKENWKFKNEDIPSNVNVKFNTTSTEYYDLMKGAKAVLLPLLDDRVAGLINILKSIQFGVLCVVSKTPSTGVYFDEESKKYLIDIGNETQLKNIIKQIQSLSSVQYKNEISRLQNYIKQNFSPEKTIKILFDFAKNYFEKIEKN